MMILMNEIKNQIIIKKNNYMKNLRFISIVLAGMLLVLSACKKDSKQEPTTGEKCKASDYRQITIGSQVWMAENYRCSKYDTESEAYKEGRYTIPTSKRDFTYTPYYADASDEIKWDNDSRRYGVNLTETQIARLGYLYNWASAVGVANGEKQTTDFSGKRQGICPNGWHIPTKAEWETLYDYIYSVQKLSLNAVGKYLKTTSGWYSNGNGLDSYGFAALPAGCANGSNVEMVGHNTRFWTTATDVKYWGESNSAYYRYLDYSKDYLDYNKFSYDKSYGLSVRCLKD